MGIIFSGLGRRAGAQGKLYSQICIGLDAKSGCLTRYELYVSLLCRELLISRTLKEPRIR